MRSIVIGLGEIGGPLREVLGCDGWDIKSGDFPFPSPGYDVLNICIPYSSCNFVATVISYQLLINPKLTIIHSTVPIGTTSKIPNAVHSPILGKHGNMEQSIRGFTKWVGGPLAKEAAKYLESAGIKCREVETSEETEMMKLRCLAKYGVSIAFAQYEKELCDKYNVPYSHIWEWDTNYNEHVASHLKRPILDFPGTKIGGHCTTQNTKLLNESDPNPMLQEVLKYA